VREHHRIVLIRHGETAWSASRRHTGRTDIALDTDGKASAAALADFVEQECVGVKACRGAVAVATHGPAIKRLGGVGSKCHRPYMARGPGARKDPSAGLEGGYAG